jgi:TPR repeat protein
MRKNMAVWGLSIIAATVGTTARAAPPADLPSGINTPPGVNAAPVAETPESLTLRARRLLFANTSPQDAAQALQLLKAVSATNYGPAEYTLGALLSNDNNDPRNLEEAAGLLARAAEHGCAGAAGLLGNMLLAAVASRPQVENRVAQILRAGAENGDAQSQGLMALLSSRGSPSIPKDPLAAFAWLRLCLTHASPRIAEITRNLEPQVIAQITVADRPRAESLAQSYLAKYSRRVYPFCSQMDDFTKPPPLR